METLEFLGGKYQKTEQIVPGPVQTFRAREAATGREVFVHRVSSTEEQAEQTALLRMLTTVLLRSAEARKLVLDFGDDQGFWYVVTDSEPRCLILREWLQFELNRANSAPAVEKRAPAKPVPAPEAPTVQQTKSEPGEFTRMFEAGPRVSATPPSASARTPSPPAENEPGEFTRFFQGGLPPTAGKGELNPEVKRSQDRPSRGGFVQRPHTPVPPLPQKPTDPGEFTRIFSHPASGAPKPTLPERQEPGEYTRIFGGGTVSPPPLPRPPAEPPGSRTADDPLAGTKPLTAVPAALIGPPAAVKGPSEYTMVIQGNRPLREAGSPDSPPPSAATAGPGSAPALPQMPAIPQLTVPKVSVPKPPAMPAPAPVNLPAAASNRKLVVFFAILAVLAVVLILLVVLITVKK